MLTRLGRCALTAVICLAVLESGAARSSAVLADGPAPGASVAADPSDAFSRRARAPADDAIDTLVAAPVVVAHLDGIAGLQSSGPRAPKIWARSLAVAQTRALALPAGGLVTRGYAARAGHFGLDIVLNMNSPIAAAADGVVLRAGWDKLGYGKMIWIDHGDGLRTLYAHLNTPLVQAGDVISRGQLIGLSGNSGYSLGPHLHFEVSHNGEKLNPVAFFPEGEAGVR